jgi:hypothetical protein
MSKENNEMLKNQAKEVKHHVEELSNIINGKTNVEPWVVAKMERASTDLSDITHYLDGEKSNYRDKYSEGGNVRTLTIGDAVLYNDETWYVSEKNGVLGIKTFRQGAWGRDYPFINLSELNQNTLTDMYGNKVSIEKMANGGGIEEPMYEKNYMVSKPYYYEEDGFFSTKEYRLNTKFTDYSYAAMPIYKGIMTKKEALEKANAFYEYVKNAKTEKEYEILVEKFKNFWNSKKSDGGAVNVKYAVVDDNSDRVYVKSTDKDYIEKKLKELQEIYPNDKLIVERFENNYADGGVILSLKDKKYDITYTVRKSPTRDDRWEVVSSSPNWKKDDVLEFVSKEDAINNAKLSAGVLKENDPEAYFMRNEFADGGVVVGDIFESAENKSKFRIARINDDGYVIKSVTYPNELPEFLTKSEFNRFYSAGFYKKMAEGGNLSAETQDKIAKLQKVVDSTMIPENVKEKARLEIEKLRSEGMSKGDKDDMTLGEQDFEQRELNKSVLKLIESKKISTQTQFEQIVAEALTDANYHEQAFKFASKVDNSIKTKDDWYQSKRFIGTKTTREIGIQIAQMTGWNSDKITDALEFALKMKGFHNLASALKEAMMVEDDYPNRIETLTKNQEFYIKEIATRTVTDQRAVTEFVKDNGLTETETLNLLQGLGMKKITTMDFVTALLGNKEYEQNIVAFAKSNEAFKYEPKKEETTKVADDRLKGKHISDVSTYIPQRAIEVIVTNFNGKKVTLNGNDIFDGIYVDNKALGLKDREVKGKEIKGKGKQPKMVRTQFEEETFEFGNGGKLEDVVFVREKVYSFLNPMGYSARVEDWGNGVIHIEPSTTKVGNNRKDFFDGMQITRFDNGIYEVSEYQAGPGENEMYIYKETKSLITALKDLIKGNKRKPIKKYDNGGGLEKRPNFSKMTKKQLLAYAKKNNIGIAPLWTKEFLIEVIEDTLDSRYTDGGGAGIQKFYWKGNKLYSNNSFTGIEVTKSEDGGFNVTADYGSFYQDFEPTHTETLKQAKDYALKEVNYTFLNKSEYEDGGKISFDKAEIEELTAEYSNIYLYENGKLVYKGTLPKETADRFFAKNKAKTTIKMTDGGKLFSINPPIGRTKYSINTYDGKSTHKDGSHFIGLDSAKTKVAFNNLIKKYKADGYKEVPNVFNSLNKMADGGSVDSEIANINNRIYNLTQMKEVANPDEQEYFAIQIKNLENEKAELLAKGDKPIAAPRKRGWFFKDGGQTPAQKKKIEKVMHEFKMGTLKSSSGDKVTDKKQAIAIALSEAGLSKKADGGGVDKLISKSEIKELVDKYGNVEILSEGKHFNFHKSIFGGKYSFQINYTMSGRDEYFSSATLKAPDTFNYTEIKIGDLSPKEASEKWKDESLKKYAKGGDTQIYVYSDDDSETGLVAEIENKKFNNLLDAKNYAKKKGYKIEIVELNYGNAYNNGGGVENKLTKLKEEGKLVQYIDVYGNGTKYFQTIVPNKQEKGYWKRYLSTNKDSLGKLQNNMLSEDDLLNLFEQQTSKKSTGGWSHKK